MRVDFLSYVKEITKLPVKVMLTHGDRNHTENLQDFTDAYINKNDMEAVLAHENCKKVQLYSLEDGDVFDLGGRKLKVLFTPGHTAGSSCLLDEENKILFAGNTVSYGHIFMFGTRRNMMMYIETLQKLKQMKEDKVFTTVYCCHNEWPISPDTIDDLIACATGIQNGSIQGKTVTLPIPTDEKTRIGEYGKCRILF